MRITLHYDAGPRLQAQLDALSDRGLEIAVCPEADDARFAELLPETEILWHALRPISAEEIAGAPKLRLIQKLGVGVNTIALDAAREAGVAVCNMPGTNSRAVAEMTLLLMLGALRRVSVLDRATRAGEGWVAGPALQESYGELAGRTVGLVGYGAVPRLLAPVLEAMGAHIVYTATSAKEDAVGAWRSLDDLLAECDVVSLHLPLTGETEAMIGEAALARMKPGAVLVNTARGGLLDETAVAAALADGRLGAGGFDVFAQEPAPADHPFMALDNVVLAPHVAWLTPETLERSLEVAAENCRRLAAGDDLIHRVV